jgi:hypothetical protein
MKFQSLFRLGLSGQIYPVASIDDVAPAIANFPPMGRCVTVVQNMSFVPPLNRPRCAFRTGRALNAVGRILDLLNEDECTAERVEYFLRTKGEWEILNDPNVGVNEFWAASIGMMVLYNLVYSAPIQSFLYRQIFRYGQAAVVSAPEGLTFQDIDLDPFAPRSQRVLADLKAAARARFGRGAAQVINPAFSDDPNA